MKELLWGGGGGGVVKGIFGGLKGGTKFNILRKKKDHV